MVGEEAGPWPALSASICSYVLRPLVQDIPLSAEEPAVEAHITCVELCDDNLYIGTSRAEILHFVSIPADPADETQALQYIFASRLQPAHNAPSPGSLQALPGVQQILVLPSVQKACVLCNGTLSFYSLPELSPAFRNSTIPSCTWVGGVDLSSTANHEDSGIVVMVCVKNKVRLVRIHDEARRVRDIEFPGCLTATRRENFACVADSRSYALLDVDNQQKISLFPISSMDENPGGGKVENISSSSDSNVGRSSTPSRPISSEGSSDGKSHGRSTSLGAFVGGLGRRQGSPSSRSRERSNLITPDQTVRETSPSQGSTHARNVSTPEAPSSISITPNKPLPLPPRSDSLGPSSSARIRPPISLVPHITSPTSDEFLLTTGNVAREPGVGIFVNLDGDVVRGTLQFDQYPSTVVVDGIGIEVESRTPNEDREGFVLATMLKVGRDGERGVVEIQRWDLDNGGLKEWIEVPKQSSKRPSDDVQDALSAQDFGLRAVNTAMTIPFPDIGSLLRCRRLRLSSQYTMGGAQEVTDWEERRNEEEIEFGRRLGGRESRIVLWSGAYVWWIVKHPLAMKLDATVKNALNEGEGQEPFYNVNRSAIIQVVNSIRGQEATSETEFLSLELIRQKTSIVLFADLVARPHLLHDLQPADLSITEGLLMEGAVDPRVILYLVPSLCDEVVEGPRGIWIHGGLISVVERYKSKTTESSEKLATSDMLSLLKRYLSAWRQRKGFGSIADESEVFQTIDAALLLVLLEQDVRDPPRASKPTSTRIELYALVDSGIDCFDRAINLLELYKRLFVLSRLYQSRRMARKVLETWKRIIEGERDEGGGLVDGENEVRRYLVNIKDTGLVDEYGTWLARRNPALGVQVFTNDSSRVKWEPHQAVLLLRRKAPDAVKVYLEHLVFGKKNVQYANDLISYYLDSVLTVLSSSIDARDILSQSYETYRALRPPKPTYRHFITENAVPFPWWHDRLRLLELIGGSHGSDFSYDVDKILSRIEPYEEDLVPESIILDGRQGRHKQALRLLTHGLGDYHTAVNYCLLGGASIFHPVSGSATAISAQSQEEQAVLFGYLLGEFLRIEDVSDRLERTSELLERFGSRYDVRDVLDLIPESWSVELVSGFLISSFRRLVHERNQATITKALSGAENLQIASAFVEKCSILGPQIEQAE